jgi:hypothetical protein
MNRRGVQLGLTAALLVLGASAVAFAQAGGSDSAVGPRASSAALVPLAGDQAAQARAAARTAPASDATQMAARIPMTDEACAGKPAGIPRAAARLASGGLDSVPAANGRLAVRSGC